MKAEYAIFGILVLLFAAILFGDALLTTIDPASMLLSPNDVKGITGFVFVIVAAFFFWKAGKK
jgi:hypothetical protein